MTTPKEYPFKVEFFVLNEADQMVAFADASAASKEQWGILQSQLAGKCQELFSSAQEERNDERRLIQILFLTVEQLSGVNMLNVLAGEYLEKFAQNPTSAFAPMITVGTYDIMSLYAYPYEREMADKAPSKVLRSLKLDPRYKFLDSSIWFRYIPLVALHEDINMKEYHTLLLPELSFIDRITALLNEIGDYWAKGLYYTNAAVATLELQLRLLRESHITNKVGDGGHAEAVTPFKFHSESFLRKRTQQEKDFLEEEWGKEKLSIGAECNFRTLIVDDQACADLKLSAIAEKYADCTISKKDLITAPLAQIFKSENIEIFTPKSLDRVIQDCLEHLKDNHFDLIFLDYLLGDRQGSNGGREYGHEFLLDLLNDSKGEDFIYKRGFQGRFWIFSISSFPFALPDKLHQLGISHLQNLWHLSYGGDPITSPHLYAYYLFRFVKQKVSTYFLHPVLLLRILKENPVEVKEGNERFWAEYLENTIVNWQQHIHLASRYAQDEKSAGFTETIAWFCKQNYPLNKALELILKVTTWLKKGYVPDKFLFEHGEEFKQEELKPFAQVHKLLWSKIEAFKAINQKNLTRKFKKAINDRKLDLTYQKIHHLYRDSLHKLNGNLRELLLGHNYLETFPQALWDCKNLSRIYLNDNPLMSLDGDIQQLPFLTDLNLENTPLAEKLSIAHAQNREQVLILWKEALEIQKHRTIKKVLFFGLSPEGYKQLRIDKEFQLIKSALKGERFDLVPNLAVSYLDFQREVLRAQARIIHFAGHGNPNELVFEQGSIDFDTVIEQFFKHPFVHESINCVILNACHTETQAQNLSKLGIYVIGMRGTIEDNRAINFSGGFYNAAHLIEDGDYINAFLIGVNAANSGAEEDAKVRRDIDDSFDDSKHLCIRMWYNGGEVRV